MYPRKSASYSFLSDKLLEQAHARCRGIPGALTATQVAELETAIALYQGDLLATWYQDWCIYER